MRGSVLVFALICGIGCGILVQCIRVDVEPYNNQHLFQANHGGGLVVAAAAAETHQPQYYEQYDNEPQYDIYQTQQHYEHEPQYVSAPAPIKQRKLKIKKQKGQDFNKIPGQPGVDYPILHEVPHTNFHCGNVPATPGMYANVETGCQAYHVCHDGREGHQGAKFLCTNGTIFNQKEFTCDWWYNVNCHDAPNYYHLNSDPEHNPYFPKKKEPEVEDRHGKFLIKYD